MELFVWVEERDRLEGRNEEGSKKLGRML